MLPDIFHCQFFPCLIAGNRFMLCAMIFKHPLDFLHSGHQRQLQNKNNDLDQALYQRFKMPGSNKSCIPLTANAGRNINKTSASANPNTIATTPTIFIICSPRCFSSQRSNLEGSPQNHLPSRLFPPISSYTDIR